MKTTFIILLLIASNVTAIAQKDSTLIKAPTIDTCCCIQFDSTCRKNVDKLKDQVASELEGVMLLRKSRRITNEQKHKENDDLPIATAATFNKLTANDIAGFLTTEIAASSQSAFASLKLDHDNARAVFLPFNYIKHKTDSLPYYTINAGIDASIDGNNIFKLISNGKVNKDFNILVNVNFRFHGHTTFKAIEDAAYQKYIDTPLLAYNNCLHRKYLKECCNCDENDISADYIKDFRNKETKVVEQYSHWIRHRSWFTFSFTPLGYVGITGFDTISKETVPMHYYNPSLSLGYNKLILNNYGSSWHSINTFFFSATIKANMVNTFSEISASDWYQLNKFSDSTQAILNDKGSVYLYDPKKFQKQFLPSMNLQMMVVKNFSDQFSLGLDFNYQLNMLVPVNGQNVFKNYGSVGLVIPFKDKDDKPNINIEFFYANTLYTQKIFKDQSAFGIKFSVPILANVK